MNELLFRVDDDSGMPAGDYLVTFHENGTVSLRWRDPETERWAAPTWRYPSRLVVRSNGGQDD